MKQRNNLQLFRKGNSNICCKLNQNLFLMKLLTKFKKITKKISIIILYNNRR